MSRSLPPPEDHPDRPDLRLPALAAVAWGAALAALLLPRGGLLLLAAGLLVLTHRVRAAGRGRTLLAWWVAALAVAGIAVVRVDAVSSGPVAALARDEAVARLVLVTTSDAVSRDGPFGPVVVLHARVVDAVGRGEHHTGRAPVLVLADTDWAEVPLGTTVRTLARLAPPREGDLAAVVQPRGPPSLVAEPAAPWRAAEVVRAGIRAAVADRSEGPRALVPALVAGDDAGMDATTTGQFETAGLTHLLAVSGTNLTLVVGALLLLARWAGVRARGLLVVGLLGVAGFVLLARTEPSVVRAAAMGTVGLLAMGRHGRRHGTRVLAAAVLLLLLWDPWWAVSPGFVLSVLATAGILWLAPGWRDRLTTWTPRWVAEAVSVPLAAQLACTPVVAALSDQVSLVAVVANLLAAPAVGPATVLGLAGGLLAVAWVPLGALVAAPGAWCAGWIIEVARWSAALPTAAVPWPGSGPGLALLVALCLVGGLLLGPLLHRRRLVLLVALVCVLVLVVPTHRLPRLPSPGWPPDGWVMVACDVGQGDALVLATAPGEAVVVDAGPDPDAVDRCLRRLDVDRVPVVVLTHFHADHVAGLAGVLRGRSVGVVEVTALAEPAGGAALVREAAAAAGVPVREAAYGATRVGGSLTWQVVGPSPTTRPEDANDASVVVLARSRGVRMLLLGDQEQPAQQRLLREVPDLDVDVLKVAHHGSADFDPDLYAAARPELAVVSVGADNDYGHPAPSLLTALRRLDAEVGRTDESGDVAVVVDAEGRARMAR